MLTPEEQNELERLQREQIPIRAMARRLGRDVKTIRRALGRLPQAPQPSKLLAYQALITERFEQGLRSPRILRELRARGYTGGATILKAYLQTLGPRRPTRQTFRRFETPAGVEAQSDWSPYRVPIADRETVVHAFSLILCYSRRAFIAFFRDERLPTLLWAHQEAFQTTRVSAAGLPTITRRPSPSGASAASRAGIRRSSPSRSTMGSNRASGAPATRNAAARWSVH